MKVFNLRVRDLLNFGIVVGFKEFDAMIENLEMDSRNLQKGDWFLCLKGQNFDAHDFIDVALSKGAAGIIYEEGKIFGKTVPGLKVQNTTEFLQNLAQWHRKRLNPFVVGITGSNGKTSTKNLMDFLGKKILGDELVYSTEGNLNNHFGVPFSLLQLKPKHAVAIIEMGMNHVGEIPHLSKIAAPDIALITSVSTAHIEFMQSKKKIAIEKTSILAGINTQNKPLFFPRKIDERETILQTAKQNEGTIFESSSEDIFSNIEIAKDLMHFQYKQNALIMPALGRHQLENLALCLKAWGYISKCLDIPETSIDEALGQLQAFEQTKGRASIVANSNFILYDDTYNANEGSVLAAINFLEETYGDRGDRKVFFALGEIAELGSFTKEIHARIVKKISQSSIFGCLLFLGKQLHSDMNEAWQEKNSRWFYLSEKDDAHIYEAVKLLKKKMKKGDILFVKGSRSSKMERLINQMNLED